MAATAVITHLHTPSLGDLLSSAGVDRSSRILIQGSSGLSYLLWLCRHGYDHVGLVRSGLGCGLEQADAVIVADTCDAHQLDLRLASTPRIAPNGIILCQVRLSALHDIDSILQHHGYSAVRRLIGTHRAVLLAHRHLASQRAAA